MIFLLLHIFPANEAERPAIHQSDKNSIHRRTTALAGTAGFFTDLNAALVAQLDKLALASASASAASAAAGGSGSAAQAAALKANLTAAYNANAAKVVSTWWTLPDKLVVKVRCCWCWCWCCCWCWCWRSCCYSCCCSC